MMLDANSPEFQQRYTHYCHVYDARGRRIWYVVACDTATGEVIRLQPSETPMTVAAAFCTLPWLKVSRGRLYGVGPWKRHGFWPAPLRVVPLGGPVPAGVPYQVGHGAREQRAAIDAIEESIRPMLKRGEWLDAWRGIDR